MRGRRPRTHRPCTPPCSRLFHATDVAQQVEHRATVVHLPNSLGSDATGAGADWQRMAHFMTLSSGGAVGLTPRTSRRATMRTYHIIDADQHIIEPPDLWAKWLPKKF